MYYVYVLQNIYNLGDYYLGYSNDLKRRLNEHNNGENKSSKGKSWRLVYYEAYLSEEYARQREFRLKRNRRMKQFLLERIRESLK